MPGVSDINDWGFSSTYDGPMYGEGMSFNPYAFMTTQAGGPENPNNADVNKWMQDGGYQIGQYHAPGGYLEGLFKDGKSVTNPSFYSNGDPGPLFDLIAQGFNPVGGWGLGPGQGLGGQFASGAGAAAINGGLSGAANAGVNGGNVLTGAALGAGSAYTPNYGSGIGIENPALQGAFNGAVNGGLKAKLTDNDTTAGAVTGAVPGLASYAGGFMSDNYPSGGQSQAPWAKGNVFSSGGDYGPQMSQAPWGNSPSPSFTGPTGGPEGSPGLSDEHPIISGLKSMLGFKSSANGGGEGLFNGHAGDVAQGLLGMYQGYRQRKQAQQMMDSLAGRRQAYGDQLQKQLVAKDAAAGRRSDYAGRATQLQSSLAGLDSQMAPYQMQLSNQSLGGLAGMFQSGLTMGGRMGAFGPQYQRPQTGFQYTPMQNNVQPLDFNIPAVPQGLDTSPLDTMFRRNRVVGGY